MNAPPPPTRMPSGIEESLLSFLRALARSTYLLWDKVGRPNTFTTAETTITHTAPSTADYAIQDLTSTSPFGFVTKDEGNTVLQTIANLQARVDELETILK